MTGLSASNREPLANLTGATFFDYTGGPAATFVTALENVRGVILHTVSLSIGGSSVVFMSIGADEFVRLRSGTSESLFLKGIFVPAGLSLTVTGSDANSSARITYQVL